MIIKEMQEKTNLYITKSDSNLKIRKIGTDEVYIKAVDIIDFEYEETDIEIEKEKEND